MDVKYFPVEYDEELSGNFLEKVSSKVPEGSIGLFSSVQFLNQMKEVKSELEKDGIEVLIGSPKKRASREGQILGCDITSPLSIEEEVDAFLYVGSGVFHPLPLALETDKDIYIANPLSSQISLLSKGDKEKYLKRKKGAIRKYKTADTIGIIVSNKRWQRKMDAALSLKDKLVDEGKNPYVFLTDTLDPEGLANFPDVEVWINTACPRVGIDDWEWFDEPVLNINDVWNEVW